jgi:dihydrofolate reductase
MTIVSLVLAASRNDVIGKDNALPWHLPADLRFFKKTTLGHPVIMGRRTFDSVGKPLPGRLNVVITRSDAYAPEGVVVVGSVDEALDRDYDCDEIFVVGGSEIYRQSMKRADRIYLTRIDEDFEGDTFAPKIDPAQWHLVSREEHEPDEKNRYRYAFEVWERVDG